MKQIRHHYFGDAKIDEKTVPNYIEMLSDINFAYGIDKSAREHASKTTSDTFFYRFVTELHLFLDFPIKSAEHWYNLSMKQSKRLGLSFINFYLLFSFFNKLLCKFAIEFG